MLTKTFLLSAAMTTRADAADTSSQLFDLTDRLTATDDHRRIYVEGTESLGMAAPEMGGEGQPCYTSGEPCHRGLHCHYYKEGSAWMGKCKRDHPHKGGHGEPCRDNGSCNRGLICVRERLLPSGVTYICEEDDTPSPVPPPAPVGEAGGKCGKPPMAPCNHNNLHATNPGQEDCTCEYWLGAEADENRLGASFVGQSREGNPSLGMPAPHMGGEGEPCRNTNGLLGATECNFGLKCHYTTDGSAIFGTCRSEFTPAPRPKMGGLLEPCRDWNSPFGPCNPGLYCDYYTHHGDAVYGTCRLEGPSPTPRPVPQPRPSNQRGGLNERCYNDGTCNAGLNPTYDHLPGQALSYPVCKCRSNGYRLGATAGDDSSTKLGMPAPLFGREGEPCRSRNDPEGECDNGFTCRYKTDGSAIYGTCQRDFEFFAREGEKCGASAEWGQPEICEWGTYCKAERMLGCSYEPCTTHICTSWERRGSNLVVPGNLGEGNDASQEAESADDNISSRLPSNPGQAGERTAANGDSEQGSYSESRKDSNDDSTDGSKKLGMPAPQMGREGQPCRNTHGNECDYGFKCHYSTDGSAIFGTCQRDFTFFARKGDKCGVSAGWGNPFFCEWGTYCKSEQLLGCTGWDCTTHICTEYRLGEGNAPGSAPLPGN